MSIVYILTNDAMPGLIKIGSTSRNDVRLRIDELFNTSVPFPFKCVFAGDIENHPENVERTLHQIFSDKRANQSREFFRMDSEAAVLALRLARAKDVTPDFEDNAIPEGACYVPSPQSLKSKNTNMLKLGIPINAELTLSRRKDQDIVCKVLDGTHVDFNGETLTPSAAAAKALKSIGYKGDSYNGYGYWMYDDETILARRVRIEQEEQDEEELKEDGAN